MSAQTVRRARKLYLLALLPFPDDRPGLVPQWDGGLDIVPALELAKEQINNNSDILEGYELDLVFDDSGCNISQKAANSFMRHIYSEQDNQIVGIIGPACAPSTALVSPISGRPQIALVNIHLAATLNIEDRTVQPYSIGIGATFSVFVDAVFALMKQNNWRQVAVLYELGPLRIFHKDFQRFKQIISTEIEGGSYFPSPVKDNFLPLEDVKNNWTRLVFAFATQKLAHKIMCLAYHKEMIYPVYQWIVKAENLEYLSRPINTTYEKMNYNCSGEDMAKALNGAILLSPAMIPQDLNAPTVSGISYSQYSQEYQKRVEEYNNYEANLKPHRNMSFNKWAAVSYDAVWAMALALDKAAKQGDLNLTTYRPGQSSSTIAIRDQIHQLDFDGMSGQISFNPDTGFVVRSVNIFQALHGQQNNLGHYTDHNVSSINSSLGVFIEDHFQERTSTLRLEVAIVLLSLVLIQLLLIGAAHVMSTVYSKYRSIKASSPRLKHLLFFGCYVIIASDLLLITLKSFDIEKRVQGILCHAIWGWLFGTGFVVCLGTLSVRSWRLYRIFVHSWKPGSFLSDSKLIACVLLLVLVSVVISIVWTVIAPYNAVTVETETVEAGMRMVILQTTCSCQKGVCYVMFSIELGYLGFILLSTVTLTFLTRNIRRKNFSTISLRVLVYLLVVVLLAGVPAHFLLTMMEDKVPMWSMWSVVVICLTLNMVIFLFLIFDFAPPLMPLMKENFCSHNQSGKHLFSPTVGPTFSTTYASPSLRVKSFVY